MKLTTKELKERIPKETLKILDVPEEEIREFYSKTVGLEWKRLKMVK